jgi:MFS family permease
MDSFIYALVMVPALRELLPASGVEATQANIGFYGGLLFAVFLCGWGFAFLWGPIADRFGRVRTLILTIVCYSLFTFLGCVAANVWQLAVFRFLAGMGVGGEWTLGGVFVAEEWPESRRQKGAAWMHTGYYAGNLLAALVNYTIGARWGWRAMFGAGGVPALLVAFIRYGVHESERWMAMERRVSTRDAFVQLFAPAFRRRTVVNAALLFVSMGGLWAGSVYVPSSVTFLATHAGYSTAEAARLASYATVLLSIGTILGCFPVPALAERFGRRGALAIYFVLMGVGIVAAFGWALRAGSLTGFMACLFLLGIGGANFAVYTLWLPEQYPTTCRGSAFAFATSVGRFLAAGLTFLIGAGVPVPYTSLAFLAGLALLPLAEETRGRELPA